MEIPVQAPKVSVSVIEIFGPVIQGEGLLAGSKTMFVRFGGCDSRCQMCDSMHAVDPTEVRQRQKLMSPGHIADELKRISGGLASIPWVTLSGGNPVLWKLTELVTRLHGLGLKVAVETQGTIWRNWLWTVDVVTCSPKGPGMQDVRGRSSDTDVLDEFVGRMASSSGFNLKIVCFDSRDIQFAKFLHKRYAGIPMYLSVGNPELRESHLNVGQIRDRLLDRYQWLTEAALKEPELCDVAVLPQLHVLMYGNEEGR